MKDETLKKLSIILPYIALIVSVLTLIFVEVNK